MSFDCCDTPQLQLWHPPVAAAIRRPRFRCLAAGESWARGRKNKGIKWAKDRTERKNVGDETAGNKEDFRDAGASAQSMTWLRKRLALPSSRFCVAATPIGISPPCGRSLLNLLGEEINGPSCFHLSVSKWLEILLQLKSMKTTKKKPAKEKKIQQQEKKLKMRLRKKAWANVCVTLEICSVVSLNRPSSRRSTGDRPTKLK